jgi:7-carboxy-7-deazaguanine synthase (Cx14CxxC type)
MGVYAVKEVFGSFQGEGYHAGRPCVFVRFAGCDVWDGKEENRAEAARERGGCALYCDTDFVGTDGHNGGRYKGVGALVGVAQYEWDRCAMAIPAHCHSAATRIAVSPRKYVVFTGGEPTLQLDEELIAAFKREGWETAIETNGSNHLPPGLDWVTLSPKPPKRVVLTQASEVKCLYPDVVRNPLDYEALAAKRYVQPIDKRTHSELDALRSLDTCVQFALKHIGWKVSLQLHKLMGVP